MMADESEVVEASESPVDAGAADAPVEAVKIPEPKPDDLDTMLAEYAQQATPAKEPQTNLPATTESAHAQDIAVLKEAMEGMNHERLVGRERDDIQAVFDEGRKRLQRLDPTLPEDWSDRWLHSEYMMDKSLNAAWSDRYSSPEAMAFCERQVRKALERMTDTVRMMPNIEATADRNAVVASMMGSSRHVAPEGKPPDLSKMSDQEFREYTDKNFGFSTL